MNRISQSLRMKFKLPPAVVSLVVAVAVAVLSAPAFAAPPAPTWLPGQPMAAGTQVIAMWLPVPGAVKYIVYLEGKKISESAANQFIGLAPTGNGDFKYQVTAVDASGAESPMSKVGIITIKSLAPPRAPIFRGDPEGKAVHVRWDHVEGATIYNLYRSGSEKGPFSLVASITDLIYKDTGLELGKHYFYSVSVKDLNGKESSKSDATDVFLESESTVDAKKGRSFELTVVATKGTGVIREFQDPNTDEYISVGDVASLRSGPGGYLYMVLRSNTVLLLDDNFDLVQVVRPVSEKPLPKGFFDIAFDEDGNWYISGGNGQVYVVEPSKYRVINSFQLRKPQEEEAPEVFEALSERHRAAVPWLGAITILKDGRVMVFDAIGNIFHLLENDGTYSGWVANYLDEAKGAVEKKRFSNCKDLITLDDGSIIATLMLGRKVLRLDPEKEFSKVWQAGGWAGHVGNFIGMGGAAITPRGNLLVSDPTLSTLQVYNIETGDYLYSLGGPEGKPFAGDPSRAAVDFLNPNFPAYINGGKGLVLFPAMQHLFLKRNITGEYQPVAGG